MILSVEKCTFFGVFGLFWAFLCVFGKFCVSLCLCVCVPKVHKSLILKGFEVVGHWVWGSSINRGFCQPIKCLISVKFFRGIRCYKILCVVFSGGRTGGGLAVGLCIRYILYILYFIIQYSIYNLTDIKHFGTWQLLNFVHSLILKAFVHVAKIFVVAVRPRKRPKSAVFGLKVAFFYWLYQLLIISNLAFCNDYNLYILRGK